MELDTLTLRSDISTATPYDIAEEARAACALVQDSSGALRRIAEQYEQLASEPNGAEPLSRDRTRSAREEIRHYLLRARYLSAVDGLGLFELRTELSAILDAKGRRLHAPLLEDIEELIASHTEFDSCAGSQMDPAAVANIRDKLLTLLTDVGLTLSLQEKRQLQQ